MVLRFEKFFIILIFFTETILFGLINNLFNTSSYSFFSIRCKHTTSDLTRMNIFLELLTNADIFSTKIGEYTNTYVLINPDHGHIVDSTYASLLGNLGFLPFMIIIFILIYLLIKSFISLDKKKLSLVIIIILFAATTIITEAYPMNLLLSIIFSKEFFNNERRFHYEHSLKPA